MQEVLQGIQQAKSSKYCLHPETANCNGPIIRAHTIQRNGSLSKIVKDGKVYSFKVNNVADIEKDHGVLAPKLVGVATASTFTGFCGHHDNALFDPIEKHPFVASQEHAFLLAYRHLCMELYMKRSAINVMPLLKGMDKGQPQPFQQSLQSFASLFQDGLETGLKNVEALKSHYDKSLLAGDFSGVKYYVVRTNETPDLMCCSGIFPTHDFDGQVLQTLLDSSVTPDHLAFSVIATDKGGAIVFAWLGNNSAADKLVRSLAKQGDTDLVQSVVRFAFEFVENSYFSPSWWEGLPDDTKLAIRKRFTKAADVMAARAADCLKGDGFKLVNWTVSARETNLVV